MTTAEILKKQGFEVHHSSLFTSPKGYFRIWLLKPGHLKLRSVIDMNEGRTGITDARHFKGCKPLLNYVAAVEKNEPKLKLAA